MRYTRPILGAVAGLLILAGGSPARAQGTELRVVVPFQFTVGTATLAPGAYDVSRAGTMLDLLELRGARGITFVLGSPDSRNQRGGTPSLVFDRSGDQYFLRDVRFGGSVEMTVPESRLERQAIQQRADRSVPDRDRVVVVAELR